MTKRPRVRDELDLLDLLVADLRELMLAITAKLDERKAKRSNADAD